MSDLERLEVPNVVKQKLAQPLDPSRVKKREGRGRSQFSYLETHDVKRTMNEIFGFAGWGYTIVTQDEIAATYSNESKATADHPCEVRLSRVEELVVCDKRPRVRCRETDLLHLRRQPGARHETPADSGHDDDHQRRDRRDLAGGPDDGCDQYPQARRGQ